jgi:PAS domain S-box-containing protein
MTEQQRLGVLVRWLTPLPAGFTRHPSLRVTVALTAATAAIVVAWVCGWTLPEPRLPGYLPLHAFLETCSIISCVMVLVVSRTFFGDNRNANMTLLGAAFLGVALLDFLHILSYPGMPDMVTPSSEAKAISFWLAARLLTAAALLMAAWSSWKRLTPASREGSWLGATLILVGLVSWICLYRPHWLPRTFTPDQGLTGFKVLAELLLAAVNLSAAYGFYLIATKPLPRTTATIDPVALMAAAIVYALAGLLFAIYSDTNGVFNLLGHFYKLIAACFIYRGLVSVNLYDTQTRTMLALEGADLGLWSWDVGSDMVDFDASAAGLWRTGDGHRSTMAALGSLVHADDRAARLSALRTALDPRGDGVYRSEFRIRTADQETYLVATSTGKTLFRDGAPYRVIGIIRDVTERRRAEDTIRRSEERLNGIVSIAADAIISIDDQHRITLFNHGAETIFGYARDECIGQPIDILLPRRFRAAHDAHIDGFATSASDARRMAERREIYGLRKNGHEFPAEASISRLTIGEERTFTVVLRDNTVQRNGERQLALLNQQLEARVVERTAALQEETDRRLEAQTALSRAQRLEAFGRLAGGVAHDFNNLLTVISGNQELLEMRLKDPKEIALLKRAQEAADMGARLTGRLLTFARRRQLDPVLLDLNEQIAAMVELLQRSIGEDITLTTKLAPRLWKVRSDPSEVENAVLNLAINARDAMPNGGRLVIETAECSVGPDEVGTETKLQPGDYVRLSVSDSGGGMTPEVLARAFEPFFSTKPVGKGTGLGLSTIYGFVQQSGGTVTIHTQEGRGTTINCYLPRSFDTASGDARDRLVDREDPRGSGETILVVEDNPAVLDVTVQRVTALGYTVASAGDAKAAIARIETAGDSITLVLSDVVMPGGMSGFDLAGWLATNAPGIKILLSSGYPDQVASDPRHAPVRFRILRKPYSRSELARALRAALDAT